MAYLAPKILTCSECGFSAQIKIVVSVGPSSRKGDIPARYFHSPEPFTAELKDGKKTGTLLCPKDGTPVWTNKRGYTMEGPVTEREARGFNRHFAGTRPKKRTVGASGPFGLGSKRSLSKIPRRVGGPMKPIQPKRSS